MRQEYFELLDWLEQTRRIDPQAFFDRMRGAYGISHLAYVDAIPQGRSVHIHRLHHTLSVNDSKALANAFGDTLLPCLRYVLSAVKPVEHRHLRQHAASSAVLFDQAERFGVGLEGISFPLLSRANRRAALCIALPFPRKEISLFLRNYGRDIQALAMLFHSMVL